VCDGFFMSARLIVSVSGIRDETRDAAAEFAAEMDRRDIELSLLVAPRLKDKYRLTRDAETQDWLRMRRDHGDALVLHGYDQAATKRRRAEFATLPAHEAQLRLRAADRVMEEIGMRTRVFAPPRWVASPGAVSALPTVGFRVFAGLAGIQDLERGTTVRGRVHGIGEGFGTGSGGYVWEPGSTEPWWCRALVMGAGRTARRGGVVRLSVSAKQLGRPGPRAAMLDAVDLARFHGATSARYEWVPRSRTAVA
jgi:predicted deacetylase